MTEPLQLWFSKGIDAKECPYRYKLRQIEGIIPNKKGLALSRGTAVHRTVEFASKLLHYERNTLSTEECLALASSQMDKEMGLEIEEVKDLVSAMSFALWDNMIEEKVKTNSKLIAIEESVPVHYPEHNFIWTIKPDAIEEEGNGGQWQHEYKSTAAYGAAIQKIYHKGIQPWVYRALLRKTGLYPNLKGIKLFVTTKPLKNPPKGMKTIPRNCAMELLPAGADMDAKAEEYVLAVARRVHKLEKSRDFFKERTSCVSFFGECPYYLLCEPGVDEKSTYRQELIDAMFKFEAPDAHLKEI